MSEKMSGALHQVRAALPLATMPGSHDMDAITTCVEGGNGVMSAAPTHNENERPSTVRSFPRKAGHPNVPLHRLYRTHRPEAKLAVRCRTSASVASAPRGGVACNDAAIRQEGPILGWVRARCGCSANTLKRKGR